MKKISIAILLVSIAITSFGQAVDLRRKIDVIGISEREVTPDIINVSISLKEYLDGKNKVTISQLESALEKAVNEAGIPKDDFTINSLSSYSYVIQKKKNPDFLASKQYGIKFHDLNRFNQIISKLDPKGVQYTNIDSYDYSKINDVKQELKVQALLNARDKATYLLASLNEKLGGVIAIVENEDNTNYAAPRTMMFKSAMAADVAPESDIDVKKIKLSFRVNATFEIGK